MQVDPYAAPKATVADVVKQASDRSRPKSIWFAIFLLWLSLSIDVVSRIAVAYTLGSTDGGYSFAWTPAFVVVTLGIVTVGIWRGRHWARATLAAVYVIGFVALLALSRTLRNH